MVNSNVVYLITCCLFDCLWLTRLLVVGLIVVYLITLDTGRLNKDV